MGLVRTIALALSGLGFWFVALYTGRCPVLMLKGLCPFVWQYRRRMMRYSKAESLMSISVGQRPTDLNGGGCISPERAVAMIYNK